MAPSQAWLCLAILVIILILLNLLSPILTPFLVGISVAYMADPLADRLETMGLGRATAVTVISMLLLVLVLVLLIILIPLLSKQIDALFNLLPTIDNWINQTALPYLQTTLNLDLQSLQINTIAKRLTGEWSTTGGLMAQLIEQLTHSSVSFLGTIGTVFLAPVVSFYLLRDFDLLVTRIKAILPRNIEPNISAWAQESDQVLGAFVRGQLLVMLSLGLIYSLGLFLINLKYALLIGMLAGLASLVPYMGFFIGLLTALIVAFFQFDHQYYILLVFLVFVVGQAIESTILTPVLIGDQIGLHPVAVIFAVLAGGQLFGFVGILLALPIAAVIMVMLRHLYTGYKSSYLYHHGDPSK
jgi:predicted PurR-regulated permease PerM